MYENPQEKKFWSVTKEKWIYICENVKQIEWMEKKYFLIDELSGTLSLPLIASVRRKFFVT